MFAYLNKALNLLFITNEFYFTFQLLICSTIVAFNHTGSNFKYKMFINDFFIEQSTFNQQIIFYQLPFINIQEITKKYKPFSFSG